MKNLKGLIIFVYLAYVENTANLCSAFQVVATKTLSGK